MLTAAKIIQILWAIFLVVAFGLREFSSGTPIGITIGALSVAYFAASIGCLRDIRIAWMVALLLPLVPLVNVCIKFYMFVTGHEDYRFSPDAILFFVAIDAFVFAVPALLIYLCVFLDFKRLFTILSLSAASGGHADVIGESVPESDVDHSPYSPPRH